jgi:hypothetical protein
MISTERHVETLRLRARSARDARRSAVAIEDALRTATFKGERQDRLILVRQLRLGPLAADLSPHSLALVLERAYDKVLPVSVDARSAAAGSAATVWFESALQAPIALALRLLEGPPPSEWFWPLAVPAWTPGSSRGEALRAMALALADRPEAATALRIWVGALVEAGHAGPLLEALGSLERRQLMALAEGRASLPSGEAIKPERVLAALGLERSAANTGEVNGASTLVDGEGVAPPGGATVEDLPGESSPAPLPPGPASFAASREPNPPSAAPPAEARLKHSERVQPPMAGSLRDPAITGAAGAGEPVPSACLSPPESETTPPTPRHAPIHPPAASVAGLNRRSNQPLEMDTAAEEAGGSTPGRSPAQGPEVALLWSRGEGGADDLGLPWDLTTRAAGLLFLLNALHRLGYPAWLERRRGGMGRHQAFTLALLAGVLEQLRVPPGDPIWAALGLDLQQRCRSTLTPWKRRYQGAVTAWRRRLRRHLRQHESLGLAEVVLRPGLLHSTATHLEVGFGLNQVDLRIRLAGLDLDPGWLPWLGRVVRFRYEQETAP